MTKPKRLAALGALAALGVLAAVLLTLPVDVDADEPIPREFSFSSDPALELLQLRYYGGQMAAVFSYSVFADGRFAYRVTSEDGTKVFKSVDGQLPYEEVNSLVTLAVQAGLMEFDPERIAAEMRATRAPSEVQDGGSVSLELKLESYRGPSQPEAGPATRTLSFRSPGLRAEQHPEIEEIQALAELGERLNEHRQSFQGERTPW